MHIHIGYFEFNQCKLIIKFKKFKQYAYTYLNWELEIVEITTTDSIEIFIGFVNITVIQ